MQGGSGWVFAFCSLMECVAISSEYRNIQVEKPDKFLRGQLRDVRPYNTDGLTMRRLADNFVDMYFLCKWHIN